MLVHDMPHARCVVQDEYLQLRPISMQHTTRSARPSSDRCAPTALTCAAVIGSVTPLCGRLSSSTGNLVLLKSARDGAGEFQHAMRQMEPRCRDGAGHASMCAGLPTLEVPERRAADPGRRRPGRASPLLGARRDLVLLLRWYDLPGAQEVDAGASAAADSDSADCVLDVNGRVRTCCGVHACKCECKRQERSSGAPARSGGWDGLDRLCMPQCCLFVCCILLHAAC